MKKIFTLVMLLLVVLTGSAQPISRQEAMKRAIQFLQSSPAQGSTRRAMTATPQLNEVATDMSHLYVFNVDGGGYVIASGDERAVSVLGYSTNGTINWQRMPENMRSWLHSYDEAIAKLPQRTTTTTTTQPSAISQRASRAVIKPLLTTAWNQSPLYNDDCPAYNGQVAKYKGLQSMTGCTATAMAQVMNYHKWPQAATNDIPAYDYQVDNLQSKLTETFHLDALPAVTFDWNNMRDRYLKLNMESHDFDILPDVTPAQRKAVSTLMRYCGQSIKMSYSPEVSLQYVHIVALALTTYFGYDNGVRCVSRNEHTIDQWEDLIYSELAANRPVIYNGSSNTAGHTFVCDGYDGQGMFHFNWGWEGESDNYFSLSVLDPYSYDKYVVADSDYNQFQMAIVGVQKPQEGTVPTSVEPILALNSIPMVGVKNGNYVLSLAFIYFGLTQPTATIEIELFEKLQDGQWKQFTDNSEPLNMETAVSRSYSYEFPTSSNETDAVHDLYIKTRYKGTSEWKQISRSCIRYEVKNGRVTLIPQPELNASNFDLKDGKVTRGTGNVKSANEITLTIENKGGEFTGSFALTPYYVGNDDFETAYKTIKSPDYNNDYPQYETLSTGVYLRANSITPVKFTFRPEKEGNYLFALYNMAEPTFVLYYFMLGFPAEVTGIEAIKNDSQEKEGKFYNLAGQEIRNPQKGLYIVNGKKFVK